MSKKQILTLIVITLLAIPVAFEGGFFTTRAVHSFLAVKQKTIATDSSNSTAETAQSNISQSDTANNSNVSADNANEQASAGPAAPADSASQEAQGITFAVIGDTKTFTANANGNLEKAVRSLSKQNFDLAFVMGDLVSSCDGGNSCIAKYESWKKIMSPMLSKTYEVVGNHDRTGGNAADAVWQKEFNLPTNGPASFSKLVYSFDSGNSHFVVLDSEKPEAHIINDVQRNWLDQDLAKNKKENTFVFFHEPAFQMSQDNKDAMDAKPGERDLFWNILKKYKVTAVFNGHLHMIAGKNQDGIHQFVIGDTDSTADDTPQKNLTDFGLSGHYYAIVSVSGKTVDLKIYSLDGNVVKDYSFTS